MAWDDLVPLPSSHFRSFSSMALCIDTQSWHPIPGTTWCSNMSPIKGAAFFCANNVDLKPLKGSFCQPNQEQYVTSDMQMKKSFLYSYHCFEKQLLIFQWKLVQIWRKVARGFFNRRSHCIARYSYEGRGGRLQLLQLLLFNYYSYYYSIIIVMKGEEVVFIFAFAIFPERLLFSLD